MKSTQHTHAAFGRRDFLSALTALAAAPLLARCAPMSTLSARMIVTFEPPQRLSSQVMQLADGSFVRSFSGVAAPQNLEYLDVTLGQRRRLHTVFPKSNCPFAIDTTKQLGPEGYGLSITDRTLAGVVPTAEDPLWPANMIPFGVAIDGVIMDPSGPWYDGGPADPANPFDRGCSGWEYDPIDRNGQLLVGVPADVRGHCQPGPGGRRGSPGLFHYHGNAPLMIENLRHALTAAERREALVVGYSADGFWVLDAIVPPEATVSGKRLHLFSGYVLRSGMRVATPHTNPALVPAGTYDGTFAQDWIHDPVAKRALIEESLRTTGEYQGLLAAELAAGRAEYALLDVRNGFVTDTVRLPGVPSRSYAYVMTPDWPEVPRMFALEPAESFRRIIPLESPMPGGPPGRRQMYGACSAELSDVHQWSGRAPY